jgi:thiol-disulfide isomerase/thioredoxin
MKKLILILSILAYSTSTQAQDIPSYTADQLLQHATSKDTLYIINFWATWCDPCVAELPNFNILYNKYAGKPVKIILASLDFPESYPLRLATFVHRKGLLPQVAWFNETDANVFIPKIDSSWQGSIPATLILQPGKSFKHFIEGTITAEQIEGIVDKQLAL